MNVAILVFLYRVVQILISKYIYVSDSVVRLVAVKWRLRLWNICSLRVWLSYNLRRVFQAPRVVVHSFYICVCASSEHDFLKLAASEWPRPSVPSNSWTRRVNVDSLQVGAVVSCRVELAEHIYFSYVSCCVSQSRQSCVDVISSWREEAVAYRYHCAIAHLNALPAWEIRLPVCSHLAVKLSLGD